MALTAAEQYLLELINRARLDPAAEADRYGVALNADLDPGTISTTAKQVLAPNRQLETAAQVHSDWMLQTNTFSHTGADGSSPGDRIQDAGYTLTGQWSWRENLAWTGKTGRLDLQEAIETHHAGLYRSEGHRENTFSEVVKEVGIAQVEGRFTNGNTTYNASMLTLNFATHDTDVFITGVAYADRDGDAFYSVGEGLADVWIAAAGRDATTADAGGYGFGVAADDDVLVTLGTGNTELAALRIDVSDHNGKLDIITDNDGGMTLALSVSATLVSGIPDARLLGVADLDLTGNADDNVLTGNAGRNVLRGEAGNDQLSGGQGIDKLYGGAGDDQLLGGGGRDGLDSSEIGSENADLLIGGAGDDHLVGLSGSDVMDGGTGDDVLTGGGGRDTFIFNDGHDTITDFADNVDQITLNAAALGDADMAITDVLSLGRVVNGDAVFDFGADVLILRDVTDIDALGNDLIIV